MMRGEASHAAPDEETVGLGGSKGRKLMHNASSKVAVVVEKMLLPLLDVPLRSHVVFDAETDQAELDLMEEVDRRHPWAMVDAQAFVGHLQTLFVRYKAYAGGYSKVDQGSSKPGT